MHTSIPRRPRARLVSGDRHVTTAQSSFPCRTLIRRPAAVPVAVSLVLVGPAVAWGDAGPNENNCAGAFASGLTPELMSGEPGSFGESQSSAGRAGTVGESEQELTGTYASCGEP